jgi:hypothetical protein
MGPRVLAKSCLSCFCVAVLRLDERPLGRGRTNGVDERTCIARQARRSFSWHLHDREKTSARF